MLAGLKRTKLYQGWERLLRDLKPMTWKQRVEHIWMYYKEIMLIIAAVLMLLSFFVSVMIYQSKDILVSGMMINVTMKQEGHNYLYTQYHEDLAGGDKNKIVEFDCIKFGDMTDVENGENSYYQSMILISRVSGQMLDYMILDKYAMEFYIGNEVYLDLREFFTEEEFAELVAADKIIYEQQQGEEDRWPVVVDISDMPFVKDNVTSEGKTYFALSGNVRSLEMCRDVWNRLNAWESKAAE